jgi:orotate phosphoribosyltransferase
MPEEESIIAATSTVDLFAATRVRLSDELALSELRDDLLRAAYQSREVHLDSGVTQPYFFDKYLIIARPAILRRLSRFLAERIPHETDRVAAPTLGAVALGAAVSLRTGLPLAVVRSQWGDDGRGRAVEGGLYHGETVCLVEDVVVTGTRAIAAVERLREAGAVVASAVSVIDCERGAAARMRDAGIDYQPLFLFSDLIAKKEKT